MSVTGSLHNGPPLACDRVPVRRWVPCSWLHSLLDGAHRKVGDDAKSSSGLAFANGGHRHPRPLRRIRAGADGPTVEDATFFEQRIRPILVQRCEGCHSTAKGKTHGGLALDSAAGWKVGGDNGPALSPGRVDESLLIRAVEYKDEDLRMPPEEGGGRLPEGELALLREWVRRGAPDPRVATKPGRGGLSEKELREWWSFQPLRVVEPPSANGRSGGEIDRFLQERLDSAGLATAPLADRRTLARRVTYDLTGLPPTPEEVAASLPTNHPTRSSG